MKSKSLLPMFAPVRAKRTTRPSRAHRAVLAISIATLLGAHSAHAGSVVYWDPNGTFGSGGTGANFWDTSSSFWWVSGSSDTQWVNANNDIATFGNATAPTTVTLNTGINAGGLTFNSSNYTIAGNTLTLGGTTANITVTNSTDTATISSVLAGATTTTLNKAGAGTLTLTGANTYSGPTTVNGGTLQLGDGTSGDDGTLATSSVTVGASGTLEYNIAGSQTVSYAITGAANATLVKAGAGTLTLNNTGAVNFGNNGSTLNVTAGTLRYTNLANNSGLYQKSIIIASGATLEMSVASGALNAVGAWNASYTGSGTLLKTGAGTADLGYYSGTKSVAFSAGALIDVEAGTFRAGNPGSGSTVTWTSNQADLNVANGATFDLYGANVQVDALNGAGVVQESYNSAVTLTVGPATSANFSGSISNPTSTLSFVKTGAGTQILSGSNTFTGTTTVSAGTLNLSNANALAGSTFAGGAGALVFDSSVSSHAFAFGGLSGSSNLVLSDNAGTPNAVALTVGANNASTTYSGNLSGAGALTKSGTGTLILSGANNYAGTTLVSSGTLQFAAPQSFYGLAAPGSVSSTNVANLVVNSGATATFNVGGASDFNATDIATLLTASTGGVGFQGGSVLGLDTTNGAFNSLQAITDTPNGSLGLTKLGGSAANTLTLSAANTYTGPTLIAAGSIIANTGANVIAIPGNITLVNGGTANTNLWFTANNQLGGNGVLTFSGTAGNHGRFMPEGTSQSVAGINNNGTQSGVVENSEPGIAGPTNSGTGTITLTGSGTYSFGGYMRNSTGTLALTKTGSGTQTLIGNQINYTGSTTIGAGRLILQDTSAFASATAINGGVLELNTATSWTMSPNLSGAGNVEKTGTGTVTLSGTNTNTGTTTVTAGTLQFPAPKSFYSSATGALTSANAAKLTVKSGATAVFNVGGGSDFNGADIGTLLAASSGGVGFLGGSSLGMNATNGMFNYSSVLSDTANGALGVSAFGSGLLMLSGTNTYTGGTAVNAGTLAFTNGALGTTGNISMNGGTLQWASGNTQDISPRFVMTTGNTAAVDTNGNSITFASAIGGSTTGALTKAGAGTLTLVRSNTYTGATTVGRGTLALDFSASGAPATNIISTSSALSMGGGTLLLTGKASTTESQQFASLSLTGGADTIQLNANATANPLLLTLGAITRSTGAAVNFSLPAGTQGASNGIKTTASNTNSILGPWAFVGTNYATVSGGNIIAYTSGTAAATEANLTDTTGAVNYNLAAAGTAMPATVSANTICYTGGAGTTAPGTTSFSVNGLMNAGSGLWTIGTGTLTIGSTKELVVNTASSDISISSVVANNGTNASSLTKTGAATLTLTGSNTYTGDTAVTAGTLVYGPTAGNNFTLFAGNATVSDGATLKVDFTNVKNGSAYPSVLLNASGKTTTINAGGTLELYADPTHAMNNTAILFAANGASLSGSGTLKKTGAGAVDFWNAGPGTNFTGLIDVEDGVLTFQQNNFSGKSSVYLASSATLDLRGGSSINMQVDALNGTGVVSSSNNSTGSTLALGCNNGSGTFDGVIVNGSTVSGYTPLRDGTTTGWNGTVTLVKNGTGTQTLTGNNTYAGTTTVNAGALVVSGGIAGSTALINGGSLQVASGGTVSSTTVTLSSGSIVDNGTITHATTVNGGTLSGAGLVSGLLTVNTSATVAPGQNNSGFLTLSNGFTLNSGGHLAMTLSGTGFTAQYPTVNITGGSVTLGGDLQLSLGYTPAVGDIFYVLVNQGAGAINGTFSNAVDQGNGTGLITAGADQFLVSYTASESTSSFTGGQDIALKVIAVPEPGVLSALLGGAGILLGLRRRRKVS